MYRNLNKKLMDIDRCLKAVEQDPSETERQMLDKYGYLQKPDGRRYGYLWDTIRIAQQRIKVHF